MKIGVIHEMCKLVRAGVESVEFVLFERATNIRKIR